MKEARIALISIFLLVILVLSPSIAGVTSLDITSTTSIETIVIVPTASKPNLIANLSFGEGSGGYANDSSGNNNNGTLTNFDLSGCWVNGVVGTGLKFDGVNDYVNIEDSPDFGPMENLTVSVWVYPTKNMPIGSIISKRDCFIMHPGNGDNKITFYIYDGTWRGLGYATPIELNKWTHITGVYGNYDNEFKLYFNGVEVATDSTNYGAIIDDSGVLTIGRDDGSSRYFPGFMDEVLIYNTTLNATQVGDYYNDTLKNNVIINTTTLPRGKVNSYYETHLDGWGGTGPYTWSLASGTLPPGITLGTDGNLSGTPTQSGYFPVGIKLTDSQNINKTGVLGIPIQKNWSLQMELQMDDGAGSTAADGSGLGLDGTLTNLNLTNCWVDGINGTSLEFDGVDDYLVIPDSDGLDNQDNITVSAWVYPTGESGYHSIVSKRNAFILSISEVDNSARFYINSAGWKNTDWSVPLDYNQWTYLTGVYSNPDDIFKLYINGVEAESNPTNYGAIENDGGTLSIGRDDNMNDYFTGRIDEVMIYNTTLSGIEIGDYYNDTWKDYLLTHVFQNKTPPPTAIVSQFYDFGLTAVGGTGPYTWTVDDGVLPPGMVLTASGNITGTPTETGAWEFIMKVTEVGGTTSTRPYFIVVVGGNATIVGDWGFNDPVFNPGLDLSGYFNNGTLTNINQGKRIIPGKLETGIRFNGFDDSIRVPHSTSVDLHQDITVEMWAKAGYIDLDVDLDDVPETSIAITNITELQWIGNNPAYPLDGDYHLANGIDADITSEWNNGKGFIPIGSSSDPFTGTLDGQGHYINRLFIDRPGTSYQGIFGYAVGAIIKDIEIDDIRVIGLDYIGGLAGRVSTSTVYDITLTDVNILGNDFIGGLSGRISSSTVANIDLNRVDIYSSDDYAGGLAGYTDSGIITNAEVSGNVKGIDEKVGGLIGRADHGYIYNTQSSATVSSQEDCGGLIGFSYYGSLEASHTTGKVTGTSYDVGGLVGYANRVDISNCYATGDVSNNHNTGGLVGSLDQGRIISSYATGNIFGKFEKTGGLVGQSYSGTTINSYATGNVDGGDDYVGGLIGDLTFGTVKYSYSTGDVDGGDDRIGGLIGYMASSSVYYSFSEDYVNVGDDYVGGLAGYATSATISNCYSLGGAYNGDDMIGGLVGYCASTNVVNCWSNGYASGNSNVGGLIGIRFGGSVTSSYFNNGWTTISAGGTPVSWVQLQTQSTYVGWDFEFKWSMGGPYGWAGIQSPWYTLVQKGTGAFSMYLNPTTSILKAGIGVEYMNISVSTPYAWHHYAMTYDGSDIVAYQDGVKKGTLTVGAQTIVNGDDILFGESSIYFQGALDEVRIINNSLTEPDIFDKYKDTFKPPVIVTADVTNAYEDISYFVDYEYTDLNHDDVTWVLSTNAPFLTIDPATGLLVGNQTQTDIGLYWVNISCYDPVLSSTSHNFTLEVLNTNDAPTIDTTNVITTLEDELYSVDYDATDIDPGPDTLTWDLVTDATWLSINTTSGVLEGTPANEDVGFYSLDLWVNDGTINVSTNFTLEVVNVNDDPVIDTMDPLTVKEEAFFSLDYDGYDVDPTDDVLTWNMTTNSSWLDMTGDMLSGQAPLDESGTSYWVNITLSDGKVGSDWTNFTLTVVNVNDPPVITTSPILNATEDAPYSLVLTASDPDVGDMLIWSLVSGPDWLELNGSRLKGTPMNEDVGSNSVTIGVTDSSGLTDYLTFFIDVANTNDAPIWTIVPGNQNITENDAMFLNAQGKDPDEGDTITYSISSFPTVANLTMDPNSGQILWPGAKEGEYGLNISATDGIEIIYYNFGIIVKALPEFIEPDDNKTEPDDNKTEPDNNQTKPDPNQTIPEPGPNATMDTDKDGMPDWWEEFYGFDPKDASDASGDPDDDNYTNLEEFKAKTDPMKDYSIPPIDPPTDDDDIDDDVRPDDDTIDDDVQPDDDDTDDDVQPDDDDDSDTKSSSIVPWILVVVFALIAVIFLVLFFLKKPKSTEDGSDENENDLVDDEDEEDPDIVEEDLDDKLEVETDPEEEIDPDESDEEPEDLDESDISEDGNDLNEDDLEEKKHRKSPPPPEDIDEDPEDDPGDNPDDE